MVYNRNSVQLLAIKFYFLRVAPHLKKNSIQFSSNFNCKSKFSLFLGILSVPSLFLCLTSLPRIWVGIYISWSQLKKTMYSVENFLIFISIYHVNETDKFITNIYAFSFCIEFITSTLKYLRMSNQIGACKIEYVLNFLLPCKFLTLVKLWLYIFS